MDESIKTTHAEATPRLARQHDTRSGKDEESKKGGQEVEHHSSASRVDELVWRSYFCDEQRGMFYLFSKGEMYVRSTAQSVDKTVTTEREDHRMRRRWESLRQAFNAAMEKVLVRKDALVQEEQWIPTLPFRAVKIGDLAGVDVRLSLVFVKTEPLFHRKRVRRAVLQQREMTAGEVEEMKWHLHKVHWLRINRRQRSTKHDSLDVLAEAA